MYSQSWLSRQGVRFFRMPWLVVFWPGSVSFGPFLPIWTIVGFVLGAEMFSPGSTVFLPLFFKADTCGREAWLWLVGHRGSTGSELVRCARAAFSVQRHMQLPSADASESTLVGNYI